MKSPSDLTTFLAVPQIDFTIRRFITAPEGCIFVMKKLQIGTDIVWDRDRELHHPSPVPISLSKRARFVPKGVTVELVAQTDCLSLIALAEPDDEGRTYVLNLTRQR